MKETIQAIQQRADELIESNQEHSISDEEYENLQQETKKALIEDLDRIVYANLEQRIFLTKYKKDVQEWMYTTLPEEPWYQDLIQRGEITEQDGMIKIAMKPGELYINIVWSQIQKLLSKDPEYDAVNRVILKKDRCYLDHSRRAGRDDDLYITIATQEELTKILQWLSTIS